MDYQVLFNTAFTLCLALAGGLGGWILARITRSIDQLDRDVRKMPEKYVLKTDHSEWMQRIDEKLDKISDKLDGKADKK